MAGVFDPNKDNEEETQSPNTQGEPLTVSGGTGSTVQAGTPNVRGGNIQTRTPGSSGRFVNIQNYIQGNQQGAQSLGTGVENKVQGAAQGAQTELNNQTTAAEEGDKGNKALEAQGVQYQKDTADIGKKLGDTKQFTNAIGTVTNALDFSKNFNAQGLAAPDTVTGKATDYQNLANLSNTDTGRQELLQQTYARPSYSQGQVNLDNLLLSGSQGGQQAINRIQQNVPGTMTAINKGVSDEAARVAALNNAYGSAPTSDLQKQLYGTTDANGNPVAGQIQSGEDLIKAALQKQVQDAFAVDRSNANLANYKGAPIVAKSDLTNYVNTNLAGTNPGKINLDPAYLAHILSPSSTLDPTQVGSNLTYQPGITQADLNNPTTMNKLLGQAGYGEGGRTSQYNKLAALTGNGQELLPTTDTGLQQGHYNVNQPGLNQAWTNAVQGSLGDKVDFQFSPDIKLAFQQNQDLTTPTGMLSALANTYTPGSDKFQQGLSQIQQFLQKRALGKMQGYTLS